MNLSGDTLDKVALTLMTPRHSSSYTVLFFFVDVYLCILDPLGPLHPCRSEDEHCLPICPPNLLSVPLP
jgi:hypothetical protein